MISVLRTFSGKELATCGGITMPYRFWSIGTQLEHPKYGTGTLEFRDNEGRMIFKFPSGDDLKKARIWRGFPDKCDGDSVLTGGHIPLTFMREGHAQ